MTKEFKTEFERERQLEPLEVQIELSEGCAICGIEFKSIKDTLNMDAAKDQGDDNSFFSDVLIAFKALENTNEIHFRLQNKSCKICKSCGTCVRDLYNSMQTMKKAFEKLRGGGVLAVKVKEPTLTELESKTKYCYNCNASKGTFSSCSSRIKYPGSTTIMDVCNLLRTQNGIEPVPSKHVLVGSYHFCKPCVQLLKEFFDSENLYKKCSSKLLPNQKDELKTEFQTEIEKDSASVLCSHLTEEDTDPFAVIPKVELHQDDCPCGICRPENSTDNIDHCLSDKEGLLETNKSDIENETLPSTNKDDTQQNNSTKSILKCIVCNSPSDTWPRKWMIQKQKLAESLCKLFALPNIPYEKEFSEAPYCFKCQKKMFEVQQVFKNLEKLQDLILKLRNEFETHLAQSSFEQKQLSQSSELLETFCKEQVKVNEVRQKILNCLKLPESDLIESDTDHFDYVTVNSENRNVERLSSCNPTIPKSDDNSRPKSPPNFDDSDSDSGSNWSHQVSPVSIDQSDDDTEYKPSLSESQCIVKRVTRGRVAALKRTNLNGKSVGNIKNELSDESEDEDFEVLPKKHKVTRKRKRGSVMIVKLEQLTGEQMSEPKIKKERQRSKSSSKSKVGTKHHGKNKFKSKVKSTPKEKNKNQLDYSCDQCHRRFDSEVKKVAHVKRFHEGINRPYACDFPGCEKTYKRVGELNSHKLAHSNERPFMCDVCGKACKTAALLDFHQKNMHDASGRAFKCDKCDRSFITVQKLKLHDVTHTKIYPVICDVCGKGFTAKQFLEVHVAAKHQEVNPYKCEFEKCGKTFAHPMNLQQHQYIHTGNYPYKCPECGLGAVTKYHLKKHVRSIHTDERPFVCEICQKSFPYTHSLKKHMMSHAGTKEFACDECDKKFIDNYKLQRHKRIHRGERPYQCHICHKCFYTRDYLNIHIGYHNKATEQGKGTINQARIHRILKPGVSGARDSSSIRKKSRSTDKTISSVNAATAPEDLNASINNSSSNDVETFPQQVQQQSSTFTPIIVSTTAVTTAGSSYPTHSGEVFFQGDFYPIFP